MESPAKKKERLKPIILPKQSQVENYIKLDIQPIISEKKNTISFKINIETFQNQKFMEEDLQEITLMEDDLGNPYQPINWIKETATDYSKTGELTFPFNKNIQSIKLSFFDIEEIIFNWEIPDK